VGTIQDEKLTLQAGQLTLASQAAGGPAVAAGIQSLTGTVTFSRVLDLRMQPADISITGPLDMPLMKTRTSRALDNANTSDSDTP
jgi:hypothetical protein